MKNKKLLYFLVPSALIVWALIIYKVVNHYSDKESPDQQVVEQKQKFEIQQEKDSFIIYANYRDPFLGKAKISYNSFSGNNNYTSNNQSTERKNKEKSRPVEIIKQGKTNKWPMLVYGGLVINSKTSETVGLLTIEKQNHLVKPNQKIKEISVIEIYKDSIIVSFENSTKTINKQIK